MYVGRLGGFYFTMVKVLENSSMGGTAQAAESLFHKHASKCEQK